MISDVVRQALRKLDLSVPQGAKRCGIGVVTMYGIVKKNRMPSGNTLKKLCAGLNLDPNSLLRESPVTGLPSASQPSGKEAIIKVPVVGRIHAGEPVVADSNIERYTYIFAEKSLEGQLFALEVKGDSIHQSEDPGSEVGGKLRGIMSWVLLATSAN